MMEWNRPKLPGKHQIWMVPFGGFLLVISVFLAIPATPPNEGMISLAYVTGSLGALMLILGLIIREIRQLAFEAALRAGEAGQLGTVPIPQNA